MSKQKYTLSARNLSVADKREKSTRFSYLGITLRIGASDLTNDTIATIAIFTSTNRKRAIWFKSTIYPSISHLLRPSKQVQMKVMWQL